LIQRLSLRSRDVELAPGDFPIAQGNPVRILLAVTVYGDIDNVPPVGGQRFKPEPSAGQDIVGVEGMDDARFCWRRVPGICPQSP
jgi:hypothetical protein